MFSYAQPLPFMAKLTSRVPQNERGRTPTVYNLVRKHNLLASQRLGIMEVDEGIWLASSCTTILDISTWSKNPATPRQPVRPEIVTHVLGTFCHACVRAGH